MNDIIEFPFTCEREAQLGSYRAIKLWRLIQLVRRRGRIGAFSALSPLAQMTVALAADRYALLPDCRNDPLAAYFKLDLEHRDLVRRARGWER